MLSMQFHSNTAAVAKPGMNFDDIHENSILQKVALIIFPVEKLTVYVGLLTISDRVSCMQFYIYCVCRNSDAIERFVLLGWSGF
jgi:hypothetical protein